MNKLRMTIFLVWEHQVKNPPQKKTICGYIDLSVHHPPFSQLRPGGRPPLPGEEVGSWGNNVSFPTKHDSGHDVFAPPLCTHENRIKPLKFATHHIFQGSALARRNLIEKQTVQG